MLPDAYAIHIEHNPKRVETVFLEDMSVDFTLNAIREAKRVAVEHGLHHFLNDVSGVSTTDSRAEQFRFILTVTEQRLYDPRDTIATVVAPYTTEHDFVEVALQDRGYICRYFRSRQAALEWLGQQP